MLRFTKWMPRLLAGFMLLVALPALAQDVAAAAADSTAQRLLKVAGVLFALAVVAVAAPAVEGLVGLPALPGLGRGPGGRSLCSRAAAGQDGEPGNADRDHDP